MALKDLKSELSKIIFNVIALCYGAINMGERIQFQAKEVPRAVYVEMEASNHVRTARGLSKIYHKDQTAFPLGIKLRFASDMNLLNDKKTKEKARRMAYLQRSFTTNVKTLTTWSITDIDTKDRILIKSLREMILDIKSIEEPTKKLFLSITKGHKNKAVVVLTVFPQMEEEASIRTATLLPYLSYFYAGERVAKYFTPDEIERCKDSYWDVATKQVTSPIDAAINEFDNIALIDPEYVFDLPAALQGTVQGETAVSPVVATAIGFDSDSISTFRSGGRSTSSRRTMNSRSHGSGRSWPGRGRGTPRSPSAGINPPPTAYAEVVAANATAPTTAASIRSTNSSARSTTSGVTMDNLSIAESRIMSQVTSDNKTVSSNKSRMPRTTWKIELMSKCKPSSPHSLPSTIPAYPTQLLQPNLTLPYQRNNPNQHNQLRPRSYSGFRPGSLNPPAGRGVNNQPLDLA